MKSRLITFGVIALLCCPATTLANPFDKAVKIVTNPVSLARQSGEAERLFREAVQLKPNHTDAWYNIGLLSLRKGDLPGAKGAWKRALATNPNYYPAQSRLAAAKLKGPDKTAAIAVLEGILKKDPFQAEARNALAELAIEESKWEDAEKHCRRTLLGDPQNLNAYVNLVIVAYRQELYDKAFLIAQMGLEKNKHAPVLNNLIGLIFLKKDNSSQASKFFTRALQVDPQQIDALINLASLELAYGDFKSALARFDAVLKRQPRAAMVILSRAVALRGLGRFKEAEQGYKKALEVDPNLNDARYNLCVLYNQFTNEYTKAQAVCKAFFKGIDKKHSKYREVRRRLKSLKKLIKDELEEKKEREAEEAAKKAAAAKNAGKCKPACADGQTCSADGKCVPKE